MGNLANVVCESNEGPDMAVGWKSKTRRRWKVLRLMPTQCAIVLKHKSFATKRVVDLLANLDAAGPIRVTQMALSVRTAAPPSMKSRLFSFVHGSNHFLITALLVVCMTFKCLCVFARARRRVYFLHVCEVQSLLLSRWRRQDIRCRQQLVCVFATPHIRSGKLF